MALPNKNVQITPAQRVRIWYGLLIAVLCIFGLRLFYIQIIRYDHYKTAALSDQLKQYDIPARRGAILVHDGNATVPIVLNQQLYTLYADPVYIKNPAEVAAKIVPIVGGNADDYTKAMQTKGTRYAVLKKKVTADQQKKLLALKYPGLGLQGQDYRTYTQGNLLAQALGFVSDSGKGEYGVEQALNSTLAGKPGKLKAITDVNGVPLAASKDNIQVPAENGSDVTLTIDMAMEQNLETILAAGVKTTKASGASAIIMDPKTGAVKAMASVPTYNPAEYYKVEDGDTFNSGAVSDSIEVGSIMKPLTTAAALDQGVIKSSTTYYDPSFWKVNGFKITNIEEDGGAGTRSIADVLNLSLNTGATWELMQMGGGSINDKGRQAWYDYMANHYRFGQPTGIEQGYESDGTVPDPKENGAGINLTYANTTFGQAMTATPIQIAAAMSAVANGGTYYQPHLVEQTEDGAGTKTVIKPKVVQKDVVSPATTAALLPMMEYTVSKHSFSPSFDQSMYAVGGKTGTAQITKPNGGYYDDKFNGTYMGYVGGDAPQYVIVVFVDKPTNGGYAGTAAAQPIFGSLAHMLINNSYVVPKT